MRRIFPITRLNDSKSRTGYVGVETRYFSAYYTSILQCFYFTPEIRKVIYEWDFDAYTEKEMAKLKDEEDEEMARIETMERLLNDSVMRHIQLLFARLDLFDIRDVSGKYLGRALGWTREKSLTCSVEEFIEHLIDKMEKEIGESKISDVIRISVKKFLTCTECGHRSDATTKELGINIKLQGNDDVEEQFQIKSMEEGLTRTLQTTTLRDYPCDGILFLYFVLFYFFYFFYFFRL